MTDVLIPPDLSPEDLRSPVGCRSFSLSGDTMGTNWQVRGYLPEDQTEAAAQFAISAVHRRCIEIFSTWETTSFISRFNAADKGTVFQPPDDFETVWNAAIEIAAATGGAFNPCLGNITRLHGFGPSHAVRSANLHEHVWQGDPICRDDGTIMQPGQIELDLSAIAKGYAIDGMSRALAGLGIEACLCEIGGEFVGRGVREDRQPWWLDIEPITPDQPHFRVAACNLALATSGNTYKRKAGHSHIRETRNPESQNRRSVSVFADTAMMADAWATALYALGRDGPACADQHEIAALFQSETSEPVLSPKLQGYLG